MENARIEQISRRIFAFLIVQLTFESYSSDWEKGGTFDEKGLGHSALGKDWLCGNEFLHSGSAYFAFLSIWTHYFFIAINGE